MKKTILKITGDGAEIQIDGWNELSEKEQLTIKFEMIKKTKPMILDKLANDMPPVGLKSIKPYQIEIKKGIFGKKYVSAEISVNALEWVRLHLCACDGCTSIISDIHEINKMEEQCEK